MRHIRSLAVSLSVAALGAAPALAAPKSQPVEIRFAAAVNGAPLACGQRYTGIGSTDASLELQDFRIYVSNFRLLTKDGKEVSMALTPDGVWQDEKVALLDFEDATGNCNGNAPLNTTIKGTAPKGDYTGVVFDIGVPFEINHQDPTLAPAPLNLSATAWPWRVGYKFTTIDLETAPSEGKTATASGFSIHLGSTACGEGSWVTPPKMACSNPNRPEYRFTAFNPKTHTLVMDLGAVLATTDITTNAPQSPSGCMSSEEDNDCVGLFDRLGLTFRGKPSQGQAFITVK